MTTIAARGATPAGPARQPMTSRIAWSALTRSSPLTELSAFHGWFSDHGRTAYTNVELVALDELDGWRTDPATGNIGHHSGRFFTVEGMRVELPGGPVPHWDQPIISQPEVGILGILVKEFAGVLHFLMQAKVEPGNCNGLQLSPTVQATRSNYTGVHGGRGVPYIDYFRESSRHVVLADVRQSEQGAWFRQKRNRNMIVEVVGEVELMDGFCWLTLGQLHELLRADDLINMDARTVLSCLPFTGADLSVFADDTDRFGAALLASCDSGAASLHSTAAILSWITEARIAHEVRALRLPLAEVRRWVRTSERISHETNAFFDVIGVHVTAGGREVGQWSQPMIEPRGTGVTAFLVADLDGVLHVLVHARVEPGFVDVVELAPTVQCTPDNYTLLPAPAHSPYLDDVVHADAGAVRFAATLSEEGGRFYHARNRYLIVQTDADSVVVHPGYRWMTLHQLTDLLRHSNYLNVQARSLVACLHSLFAAATGAGTPTR
ncbi:MAG TPA: NDP-hexose 2,3-dehydratase family protein [Catenuloplanes sp.]|jgi:oxidase EvaA